VLGYSTTLIFGVLFASLTSLLFVSNVALAEGVDVKFNFNSAREFDSFYCVDKNNENKVKCPDFIEVERDLTSNVGSLFDQSDFKALDSLYLQHRDGKDKFKDGSSKLYNLEKMLENHFKVWQNWQSQLKILKRWQSENPKSVFAYISEAIYWCAYASMLEHALISKGKEESVRLLFDQRMKKAANVMQSLSAQAHENPTWYSLSIRIKNSIGNSKAELKKIFVSGQKTFPDNLGIYLAMAEAFEPRWGGSESAFDQFATEASRLSDKFDGEAMYARIYSTESAKSNLSFKLGKEFPNTQRLLLSFSKLNALYPNSETILNEYLHFVCKKGDAFNYEKLRKQLGIYVQSSVFTNPSVEVCDKKFSPTTRPISDKLAFQR
jgi:Domain of unknown function (DUF4034)